MNLSSLRRTARRLPTWAWIVIILTVGFAAVGATQPDQQPKVETSEATTAPATSTTTTPPPPTTARATTTTKPKPTTTTTTIPVIDSGIYIVSQDIQPGAYRVVGYFARLDANMDIIDNDGVYGANEITYVEIQTSDAYFELSGEAISIDDFPTYDPILMGAKRGTYLVGRDIQPGRYRVEDPVYAYAARLKCNRDIIDNAGNKGNVIIIIRDSDCLFEYSGAISRID